MSLAVLDLAAQSHQVIGQQTIYELVPSARARINSVYMTTTFVGGALASALTGLIYARLGWGASCAFGASLAGVGLIAWLGASVGGRAVYPPPRMPARIGA